MTTPGCGSRCRRWACRCGGPSTRPSATRLRRRSLAFTPGNGADYTGRAEIRAALSTDDFAQVGFAYRVAGTQAWNKLGVDDNAPYRVFHDVSTLPTGTLVEYRMVAKDIRDHYSATSTYGIVGTQGAAGHGPAAAARSPSPTSPPSPGTTTVRWGVRADWQPDCSQAQLTRDLKDDIWRTTATVPAGNYAYKVAINKTWDVNYGAGGALNGGNIAYTAPGTPVKFYYDHRTHNIVNSAQGPLIAAAGSFQSEQGCPADWSAGLPARLAGRPGR